MNNADIETQVRANLDEIHRRYKKLKRENVVRHIAIFELTIALAGFIYLLWYIWGLG